MYPCKKNVRIFRPSFIPAIAWLIISTILLTLPGSTLPKESWLDNLYIDKWVHISMFLIMTVTWCRAWLTRETDPVKLKRIFLWIAAASAGFGIVMEFVQLFWIPNRAFEVKDILADTLGSLLGLALSARWYIKK